MAAHIIYCIYCTFLLTAKEDNDMKDIAIDATTRLKQAVTNEREVKLRLKEENEQLKVWPKNNIYVFPVT